MSKAMQLMGSKISLISKSEIRYEGTLFTLNPNESTLALAKVRMFGTENRPTDNPVAARDEVFEFIIFRGQDIKDIRLCEAPLPQPTMPGGLPYDPAIVQHSVPGVGSLGAGLQQPTGLSGSMMRPAFGPMGGMNNYPNLVGDGAAPGGPLGQLGNLMAPGGLGGGLGGLPGGLGLAERAIAAAASELPLSPRGDALHMPPPHPDHFSEGDQGVLSGASARSNNSTPVGGASGSASRKSPVGDGRGKNDDDDHRRTSSRGSGGQQDNRSRQNDSRRDRDRQDRDQHNQQRSGNNGGRSNSRGRSRGGNGGGGQGSGGQNRGGQGQGGQGGGQGSFNRFSNDFRNNRATKGPLKFEEDYDFESANTKFEELKSKMGKMKIGGDTVLVLSSVPGGEEGKDKTAEAGESVTAVTPVDGEAPTDTLVSGGSGANEDGAGKAPDSPVKPVCYDKTRSFFDSISCEAVERSKGNTQRTDWRQERKLNAETFGLPAQRRGGYNRGGRGYGYGGGRGYGGYGGGRGGQQRDGGYQQRDGRDGGYQNNRQDGGYQSGRNAGRQGGGGNYRSGRGGNGNYRDGHGENLGQPRGYHRRNWQQQQQQQQQDSRT